MSGRSKLALGFGFAFANGWIDAVCLVEHGAFATMMVGNMLLFATEIFGKGIKQSHFHSPNLTLPDWLFYLFLVLCFMFGVTVYRIMSMKRGWTARTFIPLFAVGIVVSDLCTSLVPVANISSRDYLLWLAPFFGIQDSFTLKHGLSTLPWSTTGHVINFAYVAGGVLADRQCSAADREAFTFSLTMMLGMILGALAAAGLERFVLQRGQAKYGLALITPFTLVLWWLHDGIFNPNLARAPTQTASADRSDSEECPSSVLADTTEIEESSAKQRSGVLPV